jgi:uncharacterized membrane protein YbhN (UPF0104 family)
MKKKFQIAIGVIVGVGLLFLLFKQADWRAVLDALSKISPAWALASILVISPIAYTRTMRLAYIVRSSEWVPLRPIFSATQIGFLAILVLPARLGEIVRVVVLSRLTKIPFSKCAAAAAFDRVSDFASLLLIIIVSLFAFKPSSDVRLPGHLLRMQNDIVVSENMIRNGEFAIAAIVIGVGAALVGVFLCPKLVLRISDACAGAISARLAKKLHTFIQHFVDGLSVLKSPADIAKTMLFSFITWAFYLLTITVVMIAFGVRFPWYAPFFIEVFVATMISVPLAPGGVGQFHVGVVAALKLMLPEMDMALAFAISLVAHAINLVPIFVFGVFCLFWEKFGIVELSRESEKSKEILKQSESES